MKFYNHLTLSVIIYLAFAYLMGINNPLYGVFIAAWMAVFPDLLDKLVGKHRGLGHSLLWLIPFTLVGIVNPYLASAMLIGFTSHLFLDILTVHGCPLLHPFRKSKFVCLNRNRRLKTGTNQDKSLFFFLIFLLIPLLILSTGLTTMLGDIGNSLVIVNNTGQNQSSSHQIINNEITITFKIDEASNKNLTIQKNNENNTNIIIKDI